MKIKKIILPLILSMSLTSCEYSWWQTFDHGANVEERIGNSIIEIPAPEVADSSDFSFIVISDVHFGRGSRKEQHFLTTVKALSPASDFCICLGDIVEHGQKGEFLTYDLFLTQLETLLNSGKVYTLVGNHDLFNSGWDYFNTLVFPFKSLFHFTVGDYSFYFADSASGSLGKKQYKMLEKAMSTDKTVNKIFSTHYPAYGSAFAFDNYYSLQNAEESAKILTLLSATNTRLYLSGHIHNYHENKFSSSFTEYVADGYLDKSKFMLVTINGNNISVSNLSF